MNKKDKKKNFENINEEYGEFVCTEFEWISPEKQKENAERLANITKKKKDKK